MLDPRHRRRVRALLGATRTASSRTRRVGEVLTKFPGVPPVDPEELGRAAVAVALGAIALSSVTHGARVLAALPLGAMLGLRVSEMLRARAAAARRADAGRALPYTLDRLATCVLAGMSVERALRVVAPSIPGPLGEALGAGLRALDAGVPRGRAYALIARRADSDDVRALMDALARAERFGTSISAALRAQAAEVRSQARAAAESDARSAPVKMIFPLVFCFLPAFVLLVIGPIAISAVRALRGI